MKIISISSLLLLCACATTRTSKTATADTAIANAKLFTAIYQQKAAEYKALCFQAFAAARWRLDAELQSGKHNKPLAILTDIDETILDNSAYAIHQGLQGKDYEVASWKAWTSRAAADTVPGAPSFLKYAASKGVSIFYITNRDENERAGTLKNLQAFQLPNADNAHLVMRGTVSSKEVRRQAVMADHEVVLLLGDNLADFSAVFDKRSADDRNAVTIQQSALFGQRFIILPNPVYGDWESALYQYNNKLTPAQKDSVLRAAGKAY